MSDKISLQTFKRIDRCYADGGLSYLIPITFLKKIWERLID